MFHVPYRWFYSPRCFFQNLDHMRWDLVHGVRNLWRWLPIVWFDRDWDWSYLGRMMEQKLRWSAELEEKYGHHVGSERDARRMRVCAEILHRLQEDDYTEKAFVRFGKTQAAVLFAEAQSKSEQQYLGKVLGKYLTGWWD